jgi:hypothetical protein
MRFWTTDLSYNDFFNRLTFSRHFVNKGKGGPGAPLALRHSKVLSLGAV